MGELVDVALAVGRFVLHHWWLVVTVLPLLFGWGHTWQRVGKLDAKWSPLLVGLVVVPVAFGLAYWRWRSFRQAVHVALLAGWLYIPLRLVGWPGRLLWLVVSYWAWLLWAAHLISWGAIVRYGVPLNWQTYRFYRWLRRQERAGKGGVRDAHDGAWVGRFSAMPNGALRARIYAAPGKSLADLEEAYIRGVLGSDWNRHARLGGQDRMHRVLVRPTGGPQGEGELIGLPDDPLKHEFAAPRLVRR